MLTRQRFQIEEFERMYLSMEMESFHFTVALSMSGEEYIHEQYRHVSGPKSYSVVLAVE